MIVKVDFIYTNEVRTLEKDSSTFTFQYSLGVNYKVLHLVNTKPAEGTFLEGYIDTAKKLQEVKIYCDGVLLQRMVLTSVELALYRCNLDEIDGVKEYIEIQYQV